MPEPGLTPSKPLTSFRTVLKSIRRPGSDDSPDTNRSDGVTQRNLPHRPFAVLSIVLLVRCHPSKRKD